MKENKDKFINKVLEHVLEILENVTEDSFEKTKEDVIQYLKGKEEALLGQHMLAMAVDAEVGRGYKEKFWQFSDSFVVKPGLILRKVRESDKDDYIELQKELDTLNLEYFLGNDAYCNLIWKEHIGDKTLMCVIEVNDEYVGYCGINNLVQDKWELAIELFQAWRQKGIGYLALRTMIDEIKKRLGVCEFRVRIEPENYASQRLFEKLGAVPKGISENVLIHEEEQEGDVGEYEDVVEDRLVAVAEKFGVEVKALRGMVLEYWITDEL